MEDMEETKSPDCGAATDNGVTACGECGKEATEEPEQISTTGKVRQDGKRTYAILVVLLVTVGGLALLLSTGVLPNPFKISDAVAIVNGERISRQEVEKKLEVYKKIYGQSNRTDFSSPEGMKTIENMKRQILDALIQEKILITEAKKEKIAVDPQEINDRITTIKKALNLTDKDFELFLKNHAMDINDFKKRVEKEFMITKLIAKGTEEKRIAKDVWMKELNDRAKIEIFTK
ncbi:MAG: SurA N-terminal domain-containing protein [Syntrophales bacterium]